MSVDYKPMHNANTTSFPNATALIQYDENDQIDSNQHQQRQHERYGSINNNELDYRHQPVDHYYCPAPNVGELPGADLRHEQTNSLSFALDEIGAIINSKEFEDLATVNKVPSGRYSNGEFQGAHFQGPPMQELHEQDGDCGYLAGNYATLDASQQQEDFKCDPTLMNLDQSNNFTSHSLNTNQQHQQLSNNQLNNYLQLKQENIFPFEESQQQQTNYIMSNNRNNLPLTLTKNPFGFGACDKKSRPYVEIVEQPAKCALRFRYKCEGRSAGSLPGANSCADSKTFPAIRINNYVGQATVVISCVTKEAPYRAHPHNIVGKEGCKKGICTVLINNEPNMIRGFSSLGIQCVKRKDIEESLSVRESIQVDPFRNGFEHKLNSSLIDLNAVRLCFQVFIEGSTPGRRDVPLTPVVSDPIHDKKAMSDLVITKLSHCSAPATGGREVILLCDRIAKDDIQLRFYEEREGKVVWETYTDISPTDVHKQVAICFKTPKYHNENITQPVMARIQLKRISDNQFSEPRYFQFLPCESDEDIITRKRQKIEWVNVNYYALDNILHQPHHNQHVQQQHLNLGAAGINHVEQQQQKAQEACLASPSLYQQPQSTANNTIQPPPRSPRRTSPNNNVASTSATTATKATNNHQGHHHQMQQHLQTQNLVVRHEIIDNEGRMVRLVDRPQQEQPNNAQTNRVPLGNSLDGIHISELMPDMTSFNLNAADFNIGSGLHILPQMDQQQQNSSQTAQGSSPNRTREGDGECTNDNLT